MSSDKHQVKLTTNEIEAALIRTCEIICRQLHNHVALDETLADRFNYLSKRLLAIQAGKPNIETEQVENSTPETSKGWA